MIDSTMIPEWMGLAGVATVVTSLYIIKDKKISPVLFWLGAGLVGANAFKLVNENTDILSSIDLPFEVPIPDLGAGSVGNSNIQELASANRVFTSAPDNFFRRNLDINAVGLRNGRRPI